MASDSLTFSFQVSSSAVSTESVAGDSGVFEDATTPSSLGSRPTIHDNDHFDDLASSLDSMMGLVETAQVQIKLGYSTAKALLHVGIERTRNLQALALPQHGKM